MPRQIWNEGRVVGYSAYEVYVKHAMSVDPEHVPATEKEWLASMMAMGSSMLLKVEPDPAGTQYDGLHYRDVQFPSDCRLCAANTIMASFFDGEGHVEGNNPWATKVTSYGSLINNNSGASPEGKLGPNGSVPPADKAVISNTHIVPQIKEYMKIVDGIIIQPGTWVDNPNKPPEKDFTPDLAEYPRLRIAFSERITTPFFLLLTGFTNRTVVDGTTGFDTAVNTLSPSDGDFLGPWAFPWSAKVIFSVPSSFINYFMNNNYTRELKSGTDAISVKSDAVVDFKQNYDENYQSGYYKNNDNNAQLPAEIVELNTLGDDAAVIASYMHSHDFGTASNPKVTILPPALYGALIQGTGRKYFIPLDTVAPGSLKLYGGSITDTTTQSPYNKACTLEDEAKHTTAFLRDEGEDASEKLTASYVVYQLNAKNEIIPVSNDTTIDLSGIMTVASNFIYWFCQYKTGGQPTYEDLQQVWRPMYQELHTGYFSSDIINRYGVSYSDWKTYTAKLPNISMYGGYWESIPELERDNYVAIMTGEFNYDHVGIKTCSFLLVNKITGAFCSVSPNIFSTAWSLPAFDFTYGSTKSGTSVNYNEDVTDFMGTWWERNDGVTYDDSNDNVLLTRPPHKHLKEAASEYTSFYMGKSFVPVYNDADYLDFRYYFDDISFASFLEKFGKTEDEILGDESGFKGLSLQKMLETAAVRDVTKPDTSSNYIEGVGEKVNYMYDKDHWPTKNEDGTINWSGPTMRYTVPGSKSLYSMRFWKFEERSADDIGKAEGSSKWIDVTSSVNKAGEHIWGAKGQSGRNETTALSVVDDNGIRLPTSGTSGNRDADVLTWDDLLYALNHNKSIDLLGALKDLKTAIESKTSGTFQIKVTNGKVSLVSV